MKWQEPYTFRKKNIIVKNRISLAPMTNGQSLDDGSLGNDEYHWLVRRAESGFGMIITCAAHVSPEGQGWPGELGIWDDKHIPGLTRLAEGIKMHGSLAIVQLFHGGARSPEFVTGVQPWSASSHIYTPGSTQVQVREASEADIIRVITDFTAAAVRAKTAGFDGIELHAAHGYLLHQFLSTATNMRTDKWGGSLDNRSRLLRKILENINNQISSGFLVGVRISPEDKYTFKGIDFDESRQLAGILAEEGADFIDVSSWNALKKPDKYPDNEKALITIFREKLPQNTALMTAGEIWSAKDAETAIEYGADMVALGRVAIAHPDWPVMATNIDYSPVQPPFTSLHLQKAGLGPAFVEYMRKWKGFVQD